CQGPAVQSCSVAAARLAMLSRSPDYDKTGVRLMRSLNVDDLKALQAPLKQKYIEDPGAAVVTLRASGKATGAISCKVETGRALVEAGLHQATGGYASLSRSGCMTLEALCR